MRPTLHLTNWSSRKLHRGRVFTIMARPRPWEHGAGRIEALTPDEGLMLAAKRERDAGVIAGPALTAYRAAYELGLSEGGQYLRPRWLAFAEWPGQREPEGDECQIRDGDTACCACSVAHARAGLCHRAWAAPFLVRAGWDVRLDGKLVTMGESGPVWRVDGSFDDPYWAEDLGWPVLP